MVNCLHVSLRFAPRAVDRSGHSTSSIFVCFSAAKDGQPLDKARRIQKGPLYRTRSTFVKLCEIEILKVFFCSSAKVERKTLLFLSLATVALQAWIIMKHMEPWTYVQTSWMLVPQHPHVHLKLWNRCFQPFHLVTNYKLGSFSVRFSLMFHAFCRNTQIQVMSTKAFGAVRSFKTRDFMILHVSLVI